MAKIPISSLNCGLMIALAVGIVGCPDATKSIEVSVALPQLVYVPGGSFDMGDAFGRGTSDEQPVHGVNLSDFEIGMFEITNQEYADVLNWALANGKFSRLNDRRAIAYGQNIIALRAPSCRIAYTGSEFIVEMSDGLPMENHPITQVTWYGAAAYCNWLSESEGLEPAYNTSTWMCNFSAGGYRLPTEAEWEYAAGWTGSAQFRYANGYDTIGCVNANIKKREYCNPYALIVIPLTNEVGFYDGANGTDLSVTPSGCFDMAGNVWEWCNDWYDPAYYGSGSGDNPTGPSVGDYRVIRGGSWLAKSRNARTAERNRLAPRKAHDDKGFRVVRSVFGD